MIGLILVAIAAVVLAAALPPLFIEPPYRRLHKRMEHKRRK